MSPSDEAAPEAGSLLRMGRAIGPSGRFHVREEVAVDLTIELVEFLCSLASLGNEEAAGGSWT